MGDYSREGEVTVTVGGGQEMPQYKRRLFAGLFEVTAALPGARRIHGVRAGVYKLAEDRFAHRPVGEHEQFIWYDENDPCLRIKLLFENKEHAMTFQSKMMAWNDNFGLCTIEGGPVVERSLRRVDCANICRVFYADYNGTDYDDSQCNSLAD